MFNYFIRGGRYARPNNNIHAGGGGGSNKHSTLHVPFHHIVSTSHVDKVLKSVGAESLIHEAIDLNRLQKAYEYLANVHNKQHVVARPINITWHTGQPPINIDSLVTQHELQGDQAAIILINVINPQGGRFGHFMVLRGNGDFFESYGRAGADEFQSSRQPYANKIFQSPHSATCGLWALLFLHHEVLRGVAIDAYVNFSVIPVEVSKPINTETLLNQHFLTPEHAQRLLQNDKDIVYGYVNPAAEFDYLKDAIKLYGNFYLSIYGLNFCTCNN
jgi:hypothetical protein